MRFAPVRAVVARPASFRRRYDLVKRPLEIVIGVLLLPIAFPVIFIAWAAVRITSSGPGFYSQTRLGRFGKPYRIFKLRSMYHNCENLSGACWSSVGDSRVTWVGRWLRKLHIDELPQIWNVLTGDMSLVGPRPERPEFVGPLQLKVPGYSNRMLVRPGVTGLAQIQLPPDSGIESVKAKTVLDLYYVENYSFSLDARIVFGTAVFVLLRLPFSAIRMIAALPKPGSNPQCQCDAKKTCHHDSLEPFEFANEARVA